MPAMDGSIGVIGGDQARRHCHRSVCVCVYEIRREKEDICAERDDGESIIPIRSDRDELLGKSKMCAMRRKREKKQIGYWE